MVRISYYGLPFFMGAILSVVFLPQISAIFPAVGILIYLFPVLIVLGVICTIWRPNWVKPTWWRWVEENHADMLPLLQERSISRAAVQNFVRWEALLGTPEGIESWIMEIRDKYGNLQEDR